MVKGDLKKEHIKGISVFGKSLSKMYIFKKRLEFLGMTFRKGGVYDKFHKRYVNISEMNDIFLMNNNVYIKPRCIISLNDRKFKTLYFNTKKEAIVFAESICDKMYIN